ncbi:unnamed protein product [Paramecium pentaurelia]|uniref:Uncharacterized protein n=1 Tax=Paramecium pentaurelia TaxID=43138 RepID=A0A8S1T487_9CILI|nr:unnamed protein product [Paramecium pentaurelia]
MIIHQNWRSENIQLIKDVIKNKNVLPPYVQGKILKQLDFQVKALENRSNESISPKRKNQNFKLITLTKYDSKFERSYSIGNAIEQECIKCKKFIFQNSVTLQCSKTQHHLHERCILQHFKELCVNNQLNFICVCGKKLSPEQMKVINIKGIEGLINSIYIKQLKEIVNSISIEKCRNPLCDFFWINDPKLQKQKQYGKQLKKMSKRYCPFC